MPRFTRSVAAKTRTTRSKAANSNPNNFSRACSEPANPRAGTAKETTAKATSSKRKREEDDCTDGVRRRRQFDREANFQILLPSSSSTSGCSRRRPSDPLHSSDEECSPQRPAMENAGQDSEDDSEGSSSSDSSSKSSEDESEEGDSDVTNSDVEEDMVQKGPVGGVSKRGDSASHGNVVNNEEKDQKIQNKTSARDASPTGGKGGKGSHPEAEPAGQMLPENDHHLFELLFAKHFESRNLAIQRALETVLPPHIAVGVANGTLGLPLAGWRLHETPTSEDICCPPVAIRPGSKVNLTTKELRETSDRFWDMKEHVSIFLTDTGGKFNPPADDPSLTDEENKRNLLIRRALKWPLLTSGFESLESFEAAKDAQLIMNQAVKDHILLSSVADLDYSKYIMNQHCSLIIFPALKALRDAASGLQQPDLVPSKIGPTASVATPAPAQPVTDTNSISTSVAQGQKRQSPCKKTPAKSGPQAPVLCSSSKTGDVPKKSRKQPENSSAKPSSAKLTPVAPPSSNGPMPSPANTSQSQTVVPSTTKASKNTSPVKTYLKRPGTPSKGSAKASPAKATTAKSSLVTPVKVLEVVSKSSTQLGKTLVEIPSAKASLAKLDQLAPFIPNSSKKARVTVAMEDKSGKKLYENTGSEKLKSQLPAVSPGKGPAPDRHQSELRKAFSQRLPPKRCPPSSSTSASSSGSESTSSSRSTSRSPSPSPPQPNVRSAAKGKQTRILPRQRATSVRRSPSSSLVEASTEPRSRPQTANSPVVPPRTPNNQSDMLLGLISRYEVMNSSCKKANGGEISEFDEFLSFCKKSCLGDKI